ncbi:Peptidase S8/S53 [Ignavibacterium album JCM 16511]|uniref:Peptidase S8/S53 n=1 Tax=Ignavibacterium album (strain DSM 19864 / JCM 16511 / NBRC 101810 / Mat9-16) TaxID=945713 RepID=I0AFU6_IGNAJ|nr:S8 family serine peptidase [Ignavibacterium album]AFH47853.1 Peptidase S8/S53 [Ignavibacterium album JCM 16511]
MKTNKTMIKILIMILISLNSYVFAQIQQDVIKEKIKQQVLSKTDTIVLKNIGIEFQRQYNANKYEAIEYFKQKGYLIKGPGIELQGFSNGRPIYYITYNRIAAQTVRTDAVWSSFNLDGSGIEIGLWDEGAVYEYHDSFREGIYGPRHVFFIDSTGSEVSEHSTHVAGTIVADNDNYNSKGMADKSVLYSRDWNAGFVEMTNAAAGLDPNFTTPLLLSNHSYGQNPGWVWGDLRNSGTNAWYWMAEDYQNEDPNFGNYHDSLTFNIDLIAFNAPYYTIVWAAGNDRGQGPEPFTSHWVWDGEKWVSSTSYHPKDGGDDGFDCIPPEGVAKNIITVGAVDDIPYGYTSPSDVKQINTNFSVWGPTKDGRIKPDIVANGDALYSTLPNNLYGNTIKGLTASGTSMAAPNVTGSLALLLQHYKNTHNNTVPLSSTLKAIVIHTADEAGENPGPDYKYGWGLLNTYKAAQLISQDQNNSNAIQEILLSNGQTYTLNDLYNDGTQPIKITLAWNDIPPSNSQTGPILVRDLDVRLYKNGITYYPWVLNPGNPGSAATTGDNTKDNVEQILFQSPGVGLYSVVVSHKGTLSSSQMFSLIVTGFTSPFVTFNLKQIGNDNQTFGQAAYWDNLSWNYVQPEQPVTLSIAQHHFLSTQDFRPNTYEKFNHWEDNLATTSDWYRNWDTIGLRASINLVAARFIPKYSNVIIKNSLEGTVSTGDSLNFSDPWLTDINEQPYGLRNQGLSAPFKQRPSPFYPDYTTSYYGDVYKGVFLNQGLDWQPPYYSVKADAVQDIQLQQTGRTHRFYFQGWSASPLGSAEFQYPNALETPVVFKQEGATVQANLKGTQLSNNSNAYSKGNQRKFV